ncbi:MAG TPA: gamma carbonic anhydrase family protein [Pseudobdellovibrionaceae bacterium]|nr:gamma carbonic anhydrase family protein [Pseudobdellovibrionaceae bacterium]
MIQKSVRGKTPTLGKKCFVAENAVLIGDVEVGDRCSIWYGAVLRGDVMPIKIGQEVNIQDNSVLHGTYGKAACEIQDRVTVGHSVVLHGCRIGKKSLVGMGSIVMDQAEVGEESIVGAGSLVTENSKFPPRSLILGRPAKRVRELSSEEVDLLDHSADNYLLYKTWYEKE